MNKFIILIVLFVGSTLQFESICKKLQVSTDIQSSKDDVVSNGVSVDKWNKNTGNISYH
jgi:hypothetical protein